MTQVRCFCQGIRDFVFRDSAESQVACRRKLKWLNLLDVMVKVTSFIVITFDIARLMIIFLSIQGFVLLLFVFFLFRLFF